MIENNQHTFKYVVGEQRVEMPHITDQYGIRFAIFLHPSVYLFAERFQRRNKFHPKSNTFPVFSGSQCAVLYDRLNKFSDGFAGILIVAIGVDYDVGAMLERIVNAIAERTRQTH